MTNKLFNVLLADLNQSVVNLIDQANSIALLRDRFFDAMNQYPSELRLYLAYMRFLAKIKSINELESIASSCLAQHPSNSWLILQSVESLVSVHSLVALDILSRFYSTAVIVDDHRWRLVFNSLYSLFDSSLTCIQYLNSLLSGTTNDFYIHSKLGQLYYLQRDYKLSYYSLISASKFGLLRSSSFVLLSESSLFLSDRLQANALSMMIAENKLRPKFKYFHSICLFSILIQRVDDSIATFLSDFRHYLSCWELLHWFNRLPFNVKQGMLIMTCLDQYFACNQLTLDWRWYYHYSVSLMLQSRLDDALCVIESYRTDRDDVSILQSSLRSLAQRVSTVHSSVNRPVNWKSDFNPYFIDCSSDVIVIFSGWTGALGYLSDCTVSEYFHQLGFNVLILRDPSLKFFSGGLSPSRFTSNYSHELYQYLSAKTSGQIFFCGDSISALAAIYHASVIPTNIKVIAFSPVLSKGDYSALGLRYFDSAGQSHPNNDLVHQSHGHQSLIRIEATRNLYPNIFDRLESADHVDLHIAYAGLNNTDSLVARYFLEKSHASLHCLKHSSVHLVSNEFIASDHFLTLLDRVKSCISNATTYTY